MIYALIAIAFVILAAAGFGVSRLIRWVKTEFMKIELALHERADLVEKIVNDEARFVRNTVHERATRVEQNVQKVEAFFKSHAAEVKAEANRLHAEGKAILDKAEALKPFGRLPRRG